MLTHCKQERLSVCTDEVFSWMMSNRLQLNPLPRLRCSGVLWSSARRQNQIPTGPVRVGDTSVQPVRTVRYLGVYIDADVTMSAHVTAVVKTCFAALRQIRSVRRSMTRTTLLTQVHALVVTKVDYCSSVLSGIPGQLLQRLQSVFNARLVFSARKSGHISPLLPELHWLKVQEIIQFRLCVVAYRCIIGTAPSYLAETLHLTADVGSRRRLRSVLRPECSTSTLVIPSTRRTTLDDRAFPVTAARAWIALPSSVRSAPSQLQFRRDLKTALFQSSYSSP